MCIRDSGKDAQNIQCRILKGHSDIFLGCSFAIPPFLSLIHIYFIPASKRMDNLVEHREESDRMQLLNGIWKFQYFNSIYDVQEPFFEKDYDTENFDEIQVPSVWPVSYTHLDVYKRQGWTLYICNGKSTN